MFSIMIDKEKIAALVEQAIENTDAYVVELTVSADNDIVVELDSATGVDLDFLHRSEPQAQRRARPRR